MPALLDPSGTLNVRSSELRRFIRYNRHLSSYRNNPIPEWRWIILLTVQNFESKNYIQHGGFSAWIETFSVWTIIQIYQYWEKKTHSINTKITKQKNTVEPNWGNSVFSVKFSTTEMRIMNFIPFSFRTSIKIRDGRSVLNGLLIKTFFYKGEDFGSWRKSTSTISNHSSIHLQN